VIDDDVHIGNILEELLSREGYRVSRAYSGTEALLVLDAAKPDLILLDLMLPGLSGEEVLPYTVGIPVIVVSAKTDVSSKVSLLLEGAVDFITKPFDTKELLARVTVALRNASSGANPLSSEVWAFGDISMNVSTQEVFVRDKSVRLTRTEFALLKILMRSPRQVATKHAILENIGADTPDCTEASLKVHISNLRKKLRLTGDREYIESVWGIGFKLIQD